MTNPEHLPAYQSEIDHAITAGKTFMENSQMMQNGLRPESSSITVSETEKDFSRGEVVTALRKMAATVALGGSLAAFGTAAWLNHEAHEAEANAPLITASMQYGNHVVNETVYDGDSLAKANELIHARNVLIPIGAAALGLAMMQSGIAVREDLARESEK